VPLVRGAVRRPPRSTLTGFLAAVLGLLTLAVAVPACEVEPGRRPPGQLMRMYVTGPANGYAWQWTVSQPGEPDHTEDPYCEAAGERASVANCALSRIVHTGETLTVTSSAPGATCRIQRVDRQRRGAYGGPDVIGPKASPCVWEYR
jgi:hypothetical protein